MPPKTNPITPDLGTLYLAPPENFTITEVEDIDPLIKIGDKFCELTIAIRMSSQDVQNLYDAILEFTHTVYSLCPNKRLVHLATHSKKARTRKKNLRRVLKMVSNLNTRIEI